MARRDTELTEELLRERPLELLNADEDELRRFLRERIADRADHLSYRRELLEAMGGGDDAGLRSEEIEEQVALAVKTLAAIREAFAVADSETLDAERVSAAVRELDDLWRKLRPVLRETIVLVTLEECGLLDGPEEIAAALERRGDDTVMLRRLSLPDVPGTHQAWDALELSPGNNLWEWLMRLLEVCWEARLSADVSPVLVCGMCGSIQGRRRSNQVYCSQACANLAWQREHRKRT